MAGDLPPLCASEASTWRGFPPFLSGAHGKIAVPSKFFHLEIAMFRRDLTLSVEMSRLTDECGMQAR
jgi:hypothetical protein